MACAGWQGKAVGSVFTTSSHSRLRTSRFPSVVESACDEVFSRKVNDFVKNRLKCKF